jgi:hypothetical protein
MYALNALPLEYFPCLYPRHSTLYLPAHLQTTNHAQNGPISHGRQLALALATCWTTARVVTCRYLDFQR